MKRCFKCEEEFPLSEFYKHKQMKDGHVNKCKSCSKKDVRKNYSDKREYYLAYDKKRYRENPSRKMANLAYAKTEQGKIVQNAAKKRWQERNAEKRAAHIILGNAVGKGKIEKPKSCSKCGADNVRICGHHHDYSKPLDVVWLCSACHAKEHF